MSLKVMSKYTFEEKLRYNRERAKQNDLFAKGYVTGVELYEEYPKSSPMRQAEIKEAVDALKYTAYIMEFSRGAMCGYRDAANERKAKEKARTAEREATRAAKRAII